MKFLKSEAGAMVLWALCSLLGAAILTPWIYIAGKDLAAHANANEVSAFAEWLGAACDRAKIGRFFSRALMLSALVLLPVLIRRVRKIGRETNAGKIMDLDKLGAKQSILHVVSAFLVAGGILWAIGMILAQAGAFTPNPNAVEGSRIVKKCLIPAISTSLIGEWLFRGIVLGLWVRASGPLKAAIGSSLLFAFLHFLKPPGGVSDPTSAIAGFELLGKVLLQFIEPEFFVTDFATLTVLSIILCWVTLRTRSLWFAIGMHAGLVVSYKSFNLLHQYTEHPLHPWGVGGDLRSGVVPLLALLAIAVVYHYIIKQLMCPCRKKKREEKASS